MKRKLITGIIAICAFCIVGYIGFKMNQTDQDWFTLQDITYDKELNKISGNSITEPYLGEMEVYLPDDMDTSQLKDGQTVEVLGGPGMTMSLPPQLMNCTKIKIVE